MWGVLIGPSAACTPQPGTASVVTRDKASPHGHKVSEVQTKRAASFVERHERPGNEQKNLELQEQTKKPSPTSAYERFLVDTSHADGSSRASASQSFPPKPTGYAKNHANHPYRAYRAPNRHIGVFQPANQTHQSPLSAREGRCFVYQGPPSCSIRPVRSVRPTSS